MLQLLAVFVLGLFLGVLYLKSGSLWLPVGFHFAWDFVLSLCQEGAKPALLLFRGVSAHSNEISLVLVLMEAVFLLIALAMKAGRQSEMKMDL